MKLLECLVGSLKIGITPSHFLKEKLSAFNLCEKDKSIVFEMIDTMLTKKKFKDFFQKNVAAL